MTMIVYSSLEAFLEHYRTLKSAGSLGGDDQRLLAEMSALIANLPAEGRTALESTESSGAARRHRERAELELRRQLVASKILAG